MFHETTQKILFDIGRVFPEIEHFTELALIQILIFT